MGNEKSAMRSTEQHHPRPVDMWWPLQCLANGMLQKMPVKNERLKIKIFFLLLEQKFLWLIFLNWKKINKICIFWKKIFKKFLLDFYLLNVPIKTNDIHYSRAHPSHPYHPHGRPTNARMHHQNPRNRGIGLGVQRNRPAPAKALYAMAS